MKRRILLCLILLLISAVSLSAYCIWTQHIQISATGRLSRGIPMNRQFQTADSESSTDRQEAFAGDETDVENKPEVIDQKQIEDTDTAAKSTERVKLDLLQSLQENNYYCVPACIQMTLRYHSIEASQHTLAQQLHTDPVTGSEYADMAGVLNSYLFHTSGIPSEQEAGYHVQTMQSTDDAQKISQIFSQRCEQNINDGYPVFAAVDLNALYPTLSHANHMVLVNGYVKEHGLITAYYILDPYPLVQDEVYKGLKLFSAEELIHAMLVNEEPAYVW